MAAAMLIVPAQAQSVVASDLTVEPALPPAVDDVATAVAQPAQVVRFQQRMTQAGDRVVQRLGVHLEVATKIVQSGQVAHESTNEMRRQQQRTIEVLQVGEGRATQARASFQVSRRQSPENETPDQLVSQPIEGKTYLMSRQGEELTVTDADGAIPPLEEYKLVAESLENVGKPNPLAILLAGKQVAVGQMLRIPRDLVQPLLGFEDPIGSVHRFELTLVRVEPAGEGPAGEDPAGEGHASPLAVFKTDIEVAPDEASPLALVLSGEMALETETCRLLSVDLKGPAQMSSIERTEGGIFQFSAGGELQLAIRSKYDRIVK